MNVAMETENVEIIKAMVASGLGMTVIPYARDRRGPAHAPVRLDARARRGASTARRAGSTSSPTIVPRAVPEVLRVFDQMKDQFGGRPPGR